MEIALAIGGALLSPAFQVLLDRLTSRDLLNDARDSKGEVLAELKKWERTLKKIYAVLDDAEEKQMTNRLVKIWVSELRNLAYDVEDILDEFATEALRRKLENEPEPVATTSKVRKFIPTCCVGFNPTTVNKFNDEMISKIKSITKKLDEILEQKDLLHLVEYSREKTGRGREMVPTTSVVNEAKVYGRDKDSEAVLDLLKAQASNAEVSVISIVGMGGLGKTTLAQLIFNHASLEFDFKSWVSVGEEFDLFRITKSILQSEGSAGEDLNKLQVTLKEKLSKKKFLIILDDVWNDNYDLWTRFSAPFESGAPGSIVVVTTRNQNVSSMMGAVQTYFLKELSNNDCLKVFAQHALGETDLDKHLDLKEIGEEIVNRCQGLPLAAKALGGLLRGKPNRNVWEQVSKSKIWDEKTNILPALRLSYYHLPSHLKQCFAYCAIFPDDYEFDKDKLVLLWKAEGFLQQPKENQPTKDCGYEYFDDLLSRSFFQKSSRNESQYVMHDLIRNLAQSVGQEICFILNESVHKSSYANVRHSSFTRHRYDTSQRFQVFHEMRSLRTFLALPISESSYNCFLTRNVLDDLLPKLQSLRVLSLNYYRVEELPSSIGSLKLLRYLDLSYTLIKRLPRSLCKLFNLQTLKLRGCYSLLELPADIDNLISLQHLDIRGTYQLQGMPLQISNLRNLCTLTKFIVGDDKRLRLSGLREFSYLKGKLHIRGLQNVENIQDAELANLKEKQGIDELELEWNLQNNENALQVLKSLQPHANLSSLSITSFGGTVFPSWMGDRTFNNMVHMQLHGCREITSLPPLGQLPLLRDLSIKRFPKVKKVGIEFYGNGHGSGRACFPSLETLNIEDMPGWEIWSSCNDLHAEAAARKFPKLHELTIRRCSMLVGKLPSCLPSLVKLYLGSCSRLTDLPLRLPSLRQLTIGDCAQEIFKSVCDFISLTSLHISNISGLVSLHEMHMQTLVALENLSVAECPDLTHLWQDGTDIAHKLSSLKCLYIRDCERLMSLVEGDKGLLPCNLQKLHIYRCCQLDKLPNGLHSLTSLGDLDINNCSKLVALPLSCLPHSLESLVIKKCDSLESLTEDSNQTRHLLKFEIDECPSAMSVSIGEFADSLKKLVICYCTTHLLESLIDRLSHLTLLDINGCSNLESFPERGLPIPTLVSLTIFKCENLRSLPNHMHDLASLHKLNISLCPGLVSFPEGGFPSNLTFLGIWKCKNLIQPMSEWGLYRLISLENLEVNGSCPSAEMVSSFPDDDGQLLPSSLIILQIDGFVNLKSISRGLQSLTSLQKLRINDCPKLQSLPMEGFPATLGHLSISIYHPLLKERCLKDKGVFWPIIAHIPSLQINYFEERRRRRERLSSPDSE